MSSRFCTLLLTTTALVPLTLAPAAANPLGAQVTGGSASVQGQGTANVTVKQTTDKAIINWNTFNIGANEATRFIQPSSASIALNRVTGGLGPSQIFGALSANGRIFVVNPDGILIGPGAKIDTAGFLATTHDIANADFMAGRYNFSIPGRPDASVVNQGTITAQSGGFAALVAPGVRNSGTITARLGNVTLASGNGFALDFYGDRLITLGVNDSIAAQVKDVATGQSLSSLVSNDGKLKANGGTVELTAVAARQVVNSVINNTGVIEANSIGTRNGMIVLSAATTASKPAGAPTQTVKVSGKLTAAGNRKGTVGGTIQVTGENIELAGATLDASGRAGGGTVLIGGDTGGGAPHPAAVAIAKATLESSPIATATTVSIDTTTLIDASAKRTGDGGKVVVWSDGTTAFGGTIKANGGAISGDGGFVEVSGRQSLSYYGLTNTLAPKGKSGTLLLDPFDVTISSSTNSNGSLIGGTFTPNGNSSVLNVTTLQNALASSNVTVTTGSSGSQAGDITVAAPVIWTSARILTLNAAHDVMINSTITANNGGLKLNAGNAISAIGAVNVGTFTLQGGAWSQISTNLPSFAATDFRISGGSFLRALSGDGSSGSPYLLSDTYGLQGIASSSLLAKHFSFANDINASGTTNWNGGAGFVPIGTVAVPFVGSLDGQYHSVDGLIINSTAANVGLFGYVGATGAIRNVGLTNISVVGGDTSSVGGLAGYNAGEISQSYVLGFVGGGLSSTVGGLVGRNIGNISQTYSTAGVRAGAGSVVGGLIGDSLGGTISQSYATGLLLGGVAPSLVGSAGTSSITKSVFVSGQYLYVADYGAGLAIFDISNPSNPVLVARDTSFGQALSVIVSGQIAYVGIPGGVKIFDVSNPTSPSLIGSYANPDFVYGLAVKDNFLFFTNYNSGVLKILNVSNPAAPTLAASYLTSGQPIAVSIVGNFAYITDVNVGVGGLGEIQILNISNPLSPLLSGTYSSNVDSPFGISVSGNYAYVADSGKGFYILDISNPPAPTRVGSYNPTGVYSGVYVSGNYVYLGGNADGLTVLNIVDPRFPTLAGANAGGYFPSVFTSGAYAYVGADVNGLKIFNVGSSGSTLGGLVGVSTGGTTTSSYWDTQTSDQGASASGTAKSTSQLTSALPSGFDSLVWGSSSTRNSGYPYLLWGSTPTPPTPTVTQTPSVDQVLAATLASLTNQTANVSKSDTPTPANTNLIPDSLLPTLPTSSVSENTPTQSANSVQPDSGVNVIGNIGSLGVFIDVSAAPKATAYGTANPLGYGLEKGSATIQLSNGSKVTLVSYSDGVYEGTADDRGKFQCTELIVRYANDLGVTGLKVGNVVDGKGVAQQLAGLTPEKFSFVSAQTAKDLPKTGAVISIDAKGTDTAGHVGIVTAVSPPKTDGSVTVTLFDQNWPGGQWKTVTFVNVSGTWRGTMSNSITGPMAVAGWANPI